MIAKGDEISGERLGKLRDEIEKRYLVTIATYGKVILRSNRAGFDPEVSLLRKEVDDFQRSAKAKLDETIKKNCAIVESRLIRIVLARPPQRWLSTLGANPSEDQIRARLQQELTRAYGQASHYLDKIDVRLIYKDVTVEMLGDPDFRKAAEKANLDLDRLYEQYEAARARA